MARTLKTMLYIYFLIYLHMVKPNVNKSELALRQKMILSLSQNLFIKNFIIIKEPSFIIDAQIISFTKLQSRSYIYTSILSAEEIKEIMNDFVSSKEVFSKTIILTFNEKSNDMIFELISMDEMAASKFLWLVWISNNIIWKRNFSYYIPYNSQLLIIEDDFEGTVSYISEIYHPRIFSPVLFFGNFGVWRENEGIEIPERDLYKRRIDMREIEINILVHPVTY